MAYTKDQLTQLKTLADTKGGFASDEFKSYVDTTKGAGSYDLIKGQLEGMQKVQPVAAPVTTPVAPIAPQDKIDTQTGAPVSATPTPTPAPTAIAPQPAKVEPVKTPTTPTTPQPIDLKSIQTVEDWKKQTGGGLNNLENWVEARYGSMATQKDGKLQSSINGETFEWTLDEAGNPIKTSLGKTDALLAQDDIAKQNTMQKFTDLLNAGANFKELNDFVKKNPNQLEDFKTSLKTYFKTTANAEFYQKYSTSTPEQLFNEYTKGNIIIGDEKYNLLPEELRQNFEEYKNLKERLLTGDAFSYTDMNKNVVNMKDILTQVNTLFSSNLRKTYEDAMNAPGISKTKEDMTSKAQEISDLDVNIKNLEDDIRAKYPGVSEGKIQALLRRENKELYRKRDELVGSYNVLAQSYSMEKEEIKYGVELAKYEDSIARDNFQTALSIYNTERQRMDAQEQRAFEVQQAELSYQRQIAMQKEMALFNEEINKTKGGQYIDDGKGNLSYVKDGKIISTLSGLGKSISQSTDGNLDFKFYENEDGSKTAFTIDKNTGKITQQTFDIKGDVAGGYLGTIGTGNITSYGGVHDGGTGLDIDGKIGDPIYAPMGGEVIEVKNYGDKGYGKSVVIRMEDGKEIRMSHLNEFGVKVGDKLEKGALLGTMGNTGYVIPGASDGSHVDIVMTENGKKWNAYQVEDYLKNVWKGEEPTQQKVYNDSQIADLAYLVELQEKNPSDARKAISELGYTDKDLANYKAGNMPLTEKQKTNSFELMSDINDLISNYDWNDTTGFHYFDEAPRGSDWATSEAKINNIVAKLTLPNLGVLKGPMSDKDLAFITAASNNLATSQNDDSFERQLINTYNLAARRAGVPEVKTLKEIKKQEKDRENLKSEWDSL